MKHLCLTLESGTFPGSTSKRQLAISPLATHEARASTQSPGAIRKSSNEGLDTPKFFEKGIAGSQVMLASTTSQAHQMLFDRARRLLNEEDAELLKQNVEQVWLLLVSYFDDQECVWCHVNM